MSQGRQIWWPPAVPAPERAPISAPLCRHSGRGAKGPTVEWSRLTPASPTPCAHPVPAPRSRACSRGSPPPLLLGSLWAPANALSYTGEVAFASDYVWRGISQTAGDPTVQGALEFEVGAGGAAVFFGLWGSNVSFDNGASLELDPYVGVSLGLNESLGLKVQATQYTYHGEGDDADNLDFSEISVTVGLPIVDIHAATSDNYLGSGSAALWSRVDVSLGLFDIGLEYTKADGTIAGIPELENGEPRVDAEGNTVYREEFDTYLTGIFGVNYEFIGLRASAELIVTSLDEEADLCKTMAGDACGTRVVLGLSRSF